MFLLLTASDVSKLVVFCAGINFLYFIAKIVYNLYFHPLRKYPGPWHVAASRLPITAADLRGTSLAWTRALHDHYGPVVRVAPNELSYTDERAWGDICNSTPAAPYGMIRKMAPVDKKGGDAGNPDSRLPRVEQKHTLMRRAFAPSLTKRALAAQEPLIAGHINSMVRHITGNITETHNVVNLYTYVVFNIFSDLFLGESLNLFDETRFIHWVHTAPLYFQGTVVIMALNRFALMRHGLKIPIYFFGIKLRDKFINVAYERIDRRLAIQTERLDMLHFALGTDSDEKRKLTTAEIRDFAPFLMIAASESTPTTVSGLTFLLLKHPEALDRVTRELRTVFKSDSEITLGGTAVLEYTNACIEETLRIYPPAATGLPRVVPNEGASIAGRWVPGGTVVHQPHGAIYNDSHNFRDPDNFIPERWLAGQDEAFSTDKRKAFNPFGVGPQACIGVDLAYAVTRLVIYKTLWNFDLKLCPESENWMSGQDVFLTYVKPPLMVKFTPVLSVGS